MLPIGWHCVQRRGARPSSALLVFPRRVSSRLGGARRFSPLSVPAGMHPPRDRAQIFSLSLSHLLSSSPPLSLALLAVSTYVLHRVPPRIPYLPLSSQHLHALAGVTGEPRVEFGDARATSRYAYTGDVNHC